MARPFFLAVCFDMHDTKREGAINLGSLYNSLDALLRYVTFRHASTKSVAPRPLSTSMLRPCAHRIYDRPTNSGGNFEVELDKFVLLVFEQIGGSGSPNGLVTFERLQALLLDTPLLHQFLSARFGEQRYARDVSENNEQKGLMLFSLQNTGRTLARAASRRAAHHPPYQAWSCP